MIRYSLLLLLACSVVAGCKKKETTQQVQTSDPVETDVNALALNMLDGTTRLFEGILAYKAEDTVVIADTSYYINDFELNFSKLNETGISIIDTGFLFSADNVPATIIHSYTSTGLVYFYKEMKSMYISTTINMTFNTKSNKVESITLIRTGRRVPGYGGQHVDFDERMDLKEQ